MKIGSIVRFSDKFLRDIEAMPSDAFRYVAGTITEIDGIGDSAVATVDWTAASRMPLYNATKYLVVVD